MKILHIDETFHPMYGYQVNPLAKFQKMQGHDVTILTVSKDHLYPVYKEFGDNGENIEQYDSAYTEQTGVSVVRVDTKGYISDRAVYSNKLFKKVDEINPDVIFVHCVETLTSMRFLLHKKKYPLVFDSHMLSMASANPLNKLYEKFFRVFFTSIIKKHNYYVIRTQDDDYVNKHLGIPAAQTPFISFGTDTMLFNPSKEVREDFRKENQIDDADFVVVYTGKLTETKGGMLLAEAFLKKFNIDKNVVLVVVGTPPTNEYGEKVKTTLEQSENRVIMFPTQKYTELAKFYQMADLSIFPKQCSMSFYDAQACGLPVLSEDNNVNVERCSHSNGDNFKSGDVADFRAHIEHLATLPVQEYQEMRDAAVRFIKSGYDYKEIAQQYTDYMIKAKQNHKK